MATDERSSGRECGGRIYRACSQNPGLIPPRAASPAAEKGSLPPAAEFLCHRAKLPLSRRAERPLRAWRAGNRLGKAPGGHGAGALPRGPDVLVAWHLQRPDSSAASRAPPPPASRLPPSRIRTRGREDSVSFRFRETHEPTCRFALWASESGCLLRADGGQAPRGPAERWAERARAPRICPCVLGWAPPPRTFIRSPHQPLFRTRP